jgi:Ca2+-binding EF-hand superfamily protein
MPKKSKVTPELTDEELRGGLTELYRQYDVDNNGHIDENELWAMLTEVIIASGVGKEGFTKEDAKTVMAALDEDSNGSVEENELVDWVLQGLKRPLADRKAFAKTSPFANRLDQFLTACGLLGTRFAKLSKNNSAKKGVSSKKVSPETNKSETKEQQAKTSVLVAINRASSTISGACDLLQLQCGLRILFMRFHVSKNATLDCDAVASIFDILPTQYDNIKETCSPEEAAEICSSLSNICTREDAPRVFQALDEDESGSIDIDEFIQWFVAGSLRDPSKQVEFAGRSAFNLRLTVSFFNSPPPFPITTRKYVKFLFSSF